jgi:squalene cyclase
MNGYARHFLLQSQNADGGWGYRVQAQSMSYVEPTAAVILALDDPPARNRARDFLLRLQQKDGGWGIAAMDSESGWMTAWAVSALAQFSEAREAVARGAVWLLGTDAFNITDEKPRQGVLGVFKIDSALRGFPWQRGDTSWVHPTALAISALVAADQRDHARVREGIAYLFDRAVEGGGWNVGNPWMIDKQIPATIQDTAVALRALRAAKAPGDPRIDAGIRFLSGALASAQTPVELAWGIYALKDWKLETGNWELESENWLARLNALQSADGGWSGNPFITAIATLAQKAL